MKNKESVHDKAIRLVEGGFVNVDGLTVKLAKADDEFNPCFCCEMDSICYFGDEMQLVCRECDSITHKDCFLILVHQ